MICRGLLRRLVVTCIGTSRKIEPVVGEPDLLKTPLQVITGRAAAQTEKTSGPGLGQTKISGGKILSRRAKRGLVTRLLASLSLAISLPDYIHSRPNTVAVALAGPFDAERAFADLKRLAAFGPRPSGSQAWSAPVNFITGQLRTVGVTVSEDRFTASTPIGAIPIVNLIARIPSASPSVVILAGHYDTKRMDVRFVGANDGASSAAFPARVPKSLP
jgi:hypothetical protein